MTELQPADVVGRIRTLLETHYVFPGVASALAEVLAAGLAAGRYPADARTLADVVTTDLQSVNGDKHLRLLFHEEALADRAPGDDAEEFAAMARWADQTCGGVACAQRLAGNVGYLDLQPVLFPAAIAADSVTAAMSLLAGTDALVVDVRGCLGGEPGMVAFLISYLWGHEPVQLTGLRARSASQLTQSWTLPHVPGRRFGQDKPVYVVTSGVTFSGGEQLAYDLQQLGRATVVGERTRGGANARQGFPVHPHLEVTISVAEAVHPGTGTNWEAAGVAPDVAAEAGQARDVAYQAALRDLIAAGGPASAAAERALAASTAAEHAPGTPA
jgi:Peptidase family S41/N-terminal domain of Peptidase_S41 in eukaryotic IRBP